MAIKVIQISDIHLGAPFHFLKSKSALHSQKVIAAFKRSIDHAIKVRADLFLIVGDLFHTPYPDKYIQQIVIDELSRLTESGIKTLLLPGNHDHDKGGIYEDNRFLLRLPDEVKLLDINGVNGVELKELGIRVYSFTVFNSISELDIKQDDLTNIALIHASVDMGKGNGRNIPIAKLRSWNLAYIALGDWHGYLEVDKNMYYSGSPEILNSDQDGSGFILEVLIQGDEISVKKIRVGEIGSIEINIDVGSVKTLEELLNLLKNKAERNMIANIELKGFRNLELVLDLERIQNYLDDFFYHVNIKDLTLFKLSENELDELSNDMLIGSYVENLKGKKASGEITEEIYQQAIQIGVNLLKGKDAN